MWLRSISNGFLQSIVLPPFGHRMMNLLTEAQGGLQPSRRGSAFLQSDPGFAQRSVEHSYWESSGGEGGQVRRFRPAPCRSSPELDQRSVEHSYRDLSGGEGGRAR